MIDNNIDELLEKKSKEEIIEILKLICYKNQNANILLNKILKPNKNKKENINKILRIIQNQNSSYKDVYSLVKSYSETSVDNIQILNLLLEASERLIDDAESMNHLTPKKLYDYLYEIYEMALITAKKQNDTVSAKKLYDIIPFDDDDLHEELTTLFSSYFDTEEFEEC